jgi:hypothetical protein
MSDPISMLRRDRVSVRTALGPPADGGAPTASGIYVVWLTSPDALPNVPRDRSEDGEIAPLYVGISPRHTESDGTIRSRLRAHFSAGLANSTLRRSLTALLWRRHGWTPALTPGDRWKLSAEDDQALLRWQRANLSVSWLVVGNPWDAEDLAVGSICPALNLVDNEDDPLHEEIVFERHLFVLEARRNASAAD